MRRFIIAIAVVAFGAGQALAQQAHGQMTMDFQLPAACEAAAGDMKMPPMNMGGMAGMTAGQKGQMDAMMAMHEPMMKAAMIKDPDMAFNCGMIVHHKGAIVMAEMELKDGKDEASRNLAQEIIDAQKKEIAEMTAWVEKNAK